MLARKLFTRLICSQNVHQPFVQLCRSAPLTCRTVTLVRQISCTACRFQDSDESNGAKTTNKLSWEGRIGYIVKEVDVEDSIRYMDSEAYEDVYADDPVWKPYRKNTKGSYYPPQRKTCIRKGIISTGSACPVCRDDYLILDYRNVKLLKQFVSDVTGKTLHHRQIGLCQKAMKKLELEVAKAQDYGFLEKSIPFRQYDYGYYYKMVKDKKALNNQSEKTIVNNQSEQSM